MCSIHAGGVSKGLSIFYISDNIYNMCESNVYLLKGEKEELVFREVVRIVPDGDGYMLYDVLGDSQKIKGKIREMNLLSHKIVFEEE